MQHHHDLRQLELDSSALTIGSFDGVHLGHQDLVRRLVESARQAGRPSVVLSFYPHPAVVLQKRDLPFYINTPDEKAAQLAELGVDHVITHTFDLKLSKLQPEQFLELLERHLAFRELWIGEDFAFGHERRGNRQFLEQASIERGFELRTVPPFKLDGEVVSATRVREALRSGDVARAQRHLGRPFSLTGEVVQGAGRGRQLGIRTANLELWEERAYPGRGVYACWAALDEERWQAVANIGVRPTFDEQHEQPIVEAHLLDFPEQRELYQQQLELSFIARLRSERKFSGPDALLTQIRRDIERARQLLEEDHDSD